MGYKDVILVFVAVFLCVEKAHAGFEWHPPVQNPAPTIQPQHPPAPQINNQAFPSSPVMAEPLPLPVPRAQNLSGRSGLVIDPYPLRSGNNAVELSGQSVTQAMAEEAELLHPLQLGNGLTTGAQPMPALQPSAGAVRGGGSMSSRNGGITPFMGGEPMPLPGSHVAPRAPVMSPAMPPTMPVQIFAEAVGFGKEIPLALALSQIIPAGFTHSFARDVDIKTTVSWQGGKPWNDVLNDMLRPNALMAIIQGNQVTISPLARL